MIEADAEIVRTMIRRERFRDEYRKRRDPIADDRLMWRSQIFRHLTHLMPGQAILELGCGDGAFTRQLTRVSRGENPITAVSFQQGHQPVELLRAVKYLAGLKQIQSLAARHFNLIVGL